MTEIIALIAKSIYLILPLLIGGLLHSIIIKKNILPRLAKPIDYGHKFRGRRLFGDNKTWRGLIFYAFNTALLTYLQSLLFRQGIGEGFSFIDFNNTNGATFGLLLGFFNSFSELPNSFIKRRLDIESGSSGNNHALAQYFMDQLDAPLVISFALYALGYVQLNEAMVIIIVGFAVHAVVDHFMYYKRGIKAWEQSEAPWKKPVTYLVQVMTMPLWKFTTFVVFRAKIINKSEDMTINSKEKFIIYSNHQSFFDAPLLSVVLGTKDVLKLLPFRYITANKHYYHPIKKLFFSLIGSYPAKPNHKNEAHGIDRSIYILNDNQTLIYFPEGKRSRKRLEPKRGLYEICNSTKPKLIPIHISWTRKSFINRTVQINIGEPYKYIDQNAEKLLDKIYELKTRQ